MTEKSYEEELVYRDNCEQNMWNKAGKLSKIGLVLKKFYFWK